MTTTATWIETYTHRQVDCLNPDPKSICIEDISHHLATTNRFSGAIYEPYSVAQHCVLMSWICPSGLAFECLMHDAAEAYIGDMVKPYKQEMPEFRGFEDIFEAAIRKAFNMPGDKHPPEVKHWDNVMLMTEARDFGMHWYGTNKHTGMPPAHYILIVPWHWTRARDEFRFRFNELQDDR